METSPLSAADIAAVAKDNDNDLGGGWMWIIVLFLFMYGNGWNRNGQGEQAVTEAGLCNAMNFNNLENAVGRLSDLTQNQTYQLGNSISSLGKEVALGQAGINQAVSNGNYALAQQMSECCCKTQSNIEQSRYDAAMNTAAINENTTAQVQKVLDAICKDKIEDLQGQVARLQLQSALCGVVRYPNATTYSAGFNPFLGGGYGTAFAA